MHAIKMIVETIRLDYISYDKEGSWFRYVANLWVNSQST